MAVVNTTEEALPIPDRKFGAYLFDLDGTIADSMPVHLITWQQAVREAGGEFPEELFWAWGGIPLPKTVEMLNERFGYNMSPPEVVHRKEQLYLTMIDRVRPIASVAAHIAAQHGKIPMAVVSGSPCLTIHKTLEALHLKHCFHALIGAEDYTHGKPDPEPFLTAAKRLNVAPADCLVFEDADAGIQSAEAAGMAWVRVPVHSMAETSL
jgi:HAD superfamily hydrolase (TIGR01509 family)